MFMWLVSVLFVYRCIILLHEDAGPFHIFEKIRNYLDEKDNQLTELYSCHNCISVWLAIFPAGYLAQNVWEFFLFLLSVSVGAIIMNRLISKL